MCDWLCVIATQSWLPHAVAKGSGERERSDCVSCENRITKLDAATHKFAPLLVLCHIAAISNRNRNSRRFVMEKNLISLRFFAHFHIFRSFVCAFKCAIL